MKRTIAVVVAVAAVLVLLALGVAAVRQRAVDDRPEPAAATSPVVISPESPTPTPTTDAAGAGFLYGRITTLDGVVYEGRLRWGGDQEAFWSDYFNGFKGENPWAAYVPEERLPTERRAIELFGIELGAREGPVDLGRPFMARFGDVARIEARGDEVRVTLKSGTVFDLDRLAAGDFDDGVRVWDATRGVVDLRSHIESLDPGRIRTIELLPTAGVGGATPARLHGTVRTRHGAELSGFLQWDREEGLGSDTLDGTTDDGELAVRFDAIRSIARRSRDSSLVTLRDGREVLLAGTNDVGEGHRGVYVDDPRYGRVLVPWEAFERVDFTPPAEDADGGGPAYGDFPPGRPLGGSVTTRDGRRLAGRLVFDLDESETTETLDAPARGVDYTIPFALVAAIELSGDDAARPTRVTLRSGEELRLEASGDLGDRNAGMLVFVDGRERPEYVPWTDVAAVAFEHPPAVSVPRGAD